MFAKHQFQFPSESQSEEREVFAVLVLLFAVFVGKDLIKIPDRLKSQKYGDAGKKGGVNKTEGAIERIRSRWSHQRSDVICILGVQGGPNQMHSAAFWSILYLMPLNTMPIMATLTRCTASSSILMALKPPTTVMVGQTEH